MKKIVIISLIAWLMIIVPHAHATGTTYYIAANGSTANTGTSASSPWPFSKVASIPFTAGTQVLFNKGDMFSGTITINASGASGNPIVLDNYGSATNNPVIDGGGSTNQTLNIAGSYVTVNNLVIQNSQNNSGVVYIGSGIHDVTVYNCYINHGIRGLDVWHSGSGGVANIKILNNYFTDFADAPSHPVGGGSAIQFNNVNGSGVEIAYNKAYTVVTPGTSTTPGVGDVLSLYQSNGTASSYMLMHDNQVRGGSSIVYGYDGIGLGDVGGSYQHAYNNILVNTGADGIQVAGGTNIIVENNKIYSAYFPYSALGINFYNVSGAPCNNITIQNNAINWIDSHNLNQNIYLFNPGSLSQSTASGVAGGPTLATPTGWATNTASSVADPSITDAILPNPLWTGSPWNTIGTTTTTTTTTTAPVISNIAVAPTTASANLTFNTDVATSNVITWGTTTAYADGNVYSGSYLTSHTIYMNNLTSGTTYHFHIVSTAQNGSVTTSSDQTFTTTGAAPTAPVVTPTPTTPSFGDTPTSTVTSDTATINWTSDQSTTSQLSYGTTTNYDVTTPLQALATSHSVTLTGLTPNTTYHYDIVITNAANLYRFTADLTFTTSAVTTVTTGGGGGGAVVIPPTTITTTAVVTTPVTTTNGGGGNGAASTVIAPVTTTTTTTTTLPVGCTISTAFSPLTGQRCSSQTVANASVGTTTFTTNVFFGIRNTDVAALQRYLNLHGFIVAPSGPGSLNNETTYFGRATKAALATFQRAAGIVPASGYCGPLTRAYINSHI